MAEKRVNEHSIAQYTAVIKDEAGVAIASGSLTTLTLTLYNLLDASIINTRDHVDALNDNNVTVDGSGNLAWILQPADNVVVDSEKELEKHIALFEYTWSGAKRGSHEVTVIVEDITKIAAL